MANIEARLWKSSQLVLASTYFPPMVRMAAAKLGKPYSQDMLEKIAATETIVDALTLPVGDSIDTAILVLMSKDVNTGAAVDAAILSAVQAYVPPAVS